MFKRTIQPFRRSVGDVLLDLVEKELGVGVHGGGGGSSFLKAGVVLTRKETQDSESDTKKEEFRKEERNWGKNSNVFSR